MDGVQRAGGMTWRGWAILFDRRRGREKARVSALAEAPTHCYAARMKTQHLSFTLGLALLLGACTHPATKPVTDAAITPLNDFNLVQAPIPPLLVAVQSRPYAPPIDVTCTALAAEVKALDELLGADLDTAPTAANPSLIERGVTLATNEAVGSLRGAAEGVVPYRRWVRKLSGAERYTADVAAAIAAGTVRRAFLKGQLTARSCL
jgi:hypothetical protein